MIAMLAAPFAIAAICFLLYRIFKYIEVTEPKLKAFYCILAGVILLAGPVIILIAFLMPLGTLKRVLTLIGNYYLGVFLFLFFSLIVCDIVRFIVHLIRKDKYNLKRAKRATVWVVIIFTLSASISGIMHAHDLQIVEYNININKESKLDSLDVVLLADLHLGYNVGITEMTDMVNKVNEINPDVIMIAGDFFTNEFEAIDEPEYMAELLSSMKSKYGTYIVLGNHDIEEKIFCGFTFNLTDEKKSKISIGEEMEQFLKDCNFNLLYDESVLIDDAFYIYGRPDKKKVNYGNVTRVAAEDITKGLDRSLPIICLDHEPVEQKELAAAGVDMTLSGHTHAGQVWPGTILSYITSPNYWGLKYFDGMADIVTSGVGLFGPDMRLGTDAEIVNIKVTFGK